MDLRQTDDDEADEIEDESPGTPEGTVVPAAPAAKPNGTQEEKVQQVKHSDFKRIKEEQRARGRQQAMAELDQAAQAVGFASMTDALKTLGELKLKPPKPAVVQQPARPNPPPGDPTMPKPKTQDTKTADRERVENMRLSEEKSRVRKQWRQEERRRRELQQQLEAKQAEMDIRDELHRAGVKDVDFALHLLTSALKGKTVEEIEAFKREEFYEGLRKERPYLFGEKVVPATTGTNGQKQDGVQPPVPPPGGAAVEEAQKKQFDARTAKPQEVADRLRALGLNPHM